MKSIQASPGLANTGNKSHTFERRLDLGDWTQEPTFTGLYTQDLIILTYFNYIESCGKIMQFKKLMMSMKSSRPKQNVSIGDTIGCN